MELKTVYLPFPMNSFIFSFWVCCLGISGNEMWFMPESEKPAIGFFAKKIVVGLKPSAIEKFRSNGILVK